MKIKNTFLILFGTMLFFGCNWQIPQKATVKASPTFNFSAGTIKNDLSKQINLDSIVDDMLESGSEQFSVYNYCPNEDAPKSFALRFSIAEVPVDFSVEDSQAQNEKTFGDDMFSEDFSESKPKGLLAAASAMKENKDLPEVQSVDLPDIDFNETVPLEAENDTASSDAFKAFDDERTGLFDLPDFDSIDLSDTPTEQTFSAGAGEELAKKALGSDELASMDFDSLSDNAGNSYDFSDSFSVGGTDFSSDSSADGKDSYDFSFFTEVFATATVGTICSTGATTI